MHLRQCSGQARGYDLKSGRFFDYSVSERLWALVAHCEWNEIIGVTMSFHQKVNQGVAMLLVSRFPRHRELSGANAGAAQ